MTTPEPTPTSVPTPVPSPTLEWERTGWTIVWHDEFDGTELDLKNWIFDHPFFIILNLAVGGGWPGYPNTTTVFPQFLYVDYVRVYQKP